MTVHRQVWVVGVLLVGAAAFAACARQRRPQGGAVTPEAFDEASGVFEELEAIADERGPVHRAPSCRTCHQNPNPGSGAQVSELGAAQFVAEPGALLAKQNFD